MSRKRWYLVRYHPLATDSGGSVKYPVTPSANDNVFFGENSFPASGAVANINDITTVSGLVFRNMTTNPTLEAALIAV